MKEAAPGFAAQDRIGRVELGNAVGAQQDHDFLYAIVQDAAALNGQLDVVDASGVPDPRGSKGTVLNGIYVSADFGDHWQDARRNAVPTWFTDLAWDGGNLYTASNGQGVLRAAVSAP